MHWPHFALSCVLDSLLSLWRRVHSVREPKLALESSRLATLAQRLGCPFVARPDNDYQQKKKQTNKQNKTQDAKQQHAADQANLQWSVFPFVSMCIAFAS